MPIRITNSQSRVSGEILASDYTTTTSTQILSTGYSQVDSLEIEFEADRTGDVKIVFNGYIEGTVLNTRGCTINMRLVNGSNQYISNTVKIVHKFIDPDSAATDPDAIYITAVWILPVTDGQTYTVRPQIKRGSTTNTYSVIYGGSYPVSMITAIGL